MDVGENGAHQFGGIFPEAGLSDVDLAGGPHAVVPQEILKSVRHRAAALHLAQIIHAKGFAGCFEIPHHRRILPGQIRDFAEDKPHLGGGVVLHRFGQAVADVLLTCECFAHGIDFLDDKLGGQHHPKAGGIVNDCGKLLLILQNGLDGRYSRKRLQPLLQPGNDALHPVDIEVDVGGVVAPVESDGFPDDRQPAAEGGEAAGAFGDTADIVFTRQHLFYGLVSQRVGGGKLGADHLFAVGGLQVVGDINK